MIKKRNILLFFVFNTLTLGIYGIVVFCKIGKEINEICDDDGLHQMHYLLATLIGMFTCGIYTLIWFKKGMDRLQDHSYRYDIVVPHSGNEYVLWMILGWLLFGAGPIIAIVYYIIDINAYSDYYGHVEALPYSKDAAERITMKSNKNYRGSASSAPGRSYQNNNGSDIKNDIRLTMGDTNGKITFTGGTYMGAEATIGDGKEFVIGRDPCLCNFILDDSYTKISGKHVAVKYHAYNDSYDVTDFSTNGTFLKTGVRLEKNKTVNYPKGVEIYLADGENRFCLG